MELRDLFCLDVEALSPARAEFAARDIIAALARGGINGTDENRLKELLVAAKRKALSVEPEQPDTRTRVKQLIEEAEQRGDKRSARILADSMVKADVAALENEERKKQAIEAANKAIADDSAAQETALRQEADFQIKTRAAQLLYARGNERGYDEKRARTDATQEVMRQPQFRRLAEEA